MRKIIVEAEISIDGAMGANNGNFWQQVFPLQSEDVKKYLNDLLFMPDALLMGRETYEGFSMVWPTRQGPDADHINAMPKYVASRTLKAPLAWNAMLLNGDAAEAVTQLKREPGGNLLQYGVGALTQTLLTAGLVDELRLLVYPFSFGAGPYVFANMGINTLKLLESKQFESGVVAMHYRPKRPMA